MLYEVITQGERGLEDLDWIVPHGVQLVLIPKVEDPAFSDVGVRYSEPYHYSYNFV